jgi:hypothetical protein
LIFKTTPYGPHRESIREKEEVVKKKRKKKENV